SVGPLPPTRTTPGSRAATAAEGRDSVPASANPLPGIVTRSSFCREIVTVRDDTAPTSSRTTSTDGPGTLHRPRRAGAADQQGAGSDRVGLLRGLTGDGDVALRVRPFDAGANGLGDAALGAVEFERERPPVGGVPHLQATRDDVDGRADAAGAGDHPAVGDARHRDLFRSE